MKFTGEYEFGTKKVSSLRFDENSIKVSFNPAPTGCNGTNSYRMHAHIDQDSPNRDVLVSGLLAAAYKAGLGASVIWYNVGGGCNTTSSLELTAFEYEKNSTNNCKKKEIV
jgi:hypothetical protein